MPNAIRNGQSLNVTIPSGQSLRVDTVSGDYTAHIIAGVGAGTVLASASTGSATHGPYASGAVVRLRAGSDAVVSFDVAESPVDGIQAGLVLMGTTAPSDADGRPDGTIYIQTGA